MNASVAELSAERVIVTPPGELRVTWLIARRAALESLRDRMALTFSAVFALVVPVLIVLFVIRPQAQGSGAHAAATLGTLLAAYLLIVGLLPSSGAIGVASGVFAGEKEQGNLAPLLATPASNRAIFGGKVLGAVLPALLYAAVAEVSYLTEVALAVGPGRLLLLPAALTLAMIALVPAYAVLEATVASLISSRVRTFQAAQSLSSLALLPIAAALFGLAYAIRQASPWLLLLTVVAIVALGAVLLVVSAATWRREEVMASR
jgi:ABC-type Na+ efflux pump permease subunit